MKKLPEEPVTITTARADAAVNKYQRWLENRATEAAGLRTKVTELEIELSKSEQTVRNLERENARLNALLAAKMSVPPLPPQYRGEGYEFSNLTGHKAA